MSDLIVYLAAFAYCFWMGMRIWLSVGLLPAPETDAVDRREDDQD